MQINWFTVIAQLINFLLLAWLLKRYLYKPVLDAIDEREKKIVAQIKDADNRKTEAIKEQDEFSKKNQQFDQVKKQLMEDAVADNKIERGKLMEQARNEAGLLQSKLETASEKVRENNRLEIFKRTQEQVIALTRKTLADLGSSGLEEQFTNVFLRRLHELKPEEKTQFINNFRSGSRAVVVGSAYEISATQKTEIENSINEILLDKTHIEFHLAPELISGIELATSGYKLSWSISEYLNSFEKVLSKS